MFEWMDLALCQQVGTELFFPEKGKSTKEPKSICERCEVQVQCLDFAIRTGDRHGIWGAQSDRERRKTARTTGQSRAGRPRTGTSARAQQRNRARLRAVPGPGTAA